MLSQTFQRRRYTIGRAARNGAVAVENLESRKLFDASPLTFATLEAEAAVGDGGIMQRGSASHQRTAYLNSVSCPTRTFSIPAGVVPAGAAVLIAARYSNDGYGETLSLELDGETIGSFQAESTGSYGYGWDNFVWGPQFAVESLGAGPHTLVVRASNGDSYGCELDQIAIQPGVTPSPVYVYGTDAADGFLVYASGNRLRVDSSAGGVVEYDLSLVASLTIEAGGGNDVVNLGPSIIGCTVDGGAGDDSITGGSGSDLIRGDAGSDTIRGNGGSDTILGNTGDDWLLGGDLPDLIQGGLGSDVIEGDAGDDTLLAGDGSDAVYGQDGNDYIEGRGKADWIYAGLGNDTVYSGAGSDVVYGGDGDDRIDVGVSSVFSDTVYGDAGVDLVRSDPGDSVMGCEDTWVV